MRAMAVVAWREIVEHRLFLAAACAALLVTLLVPLTAGLFRASPLDVLAVLMVCMTAGFTVLTAVALGASTVAGTAAAGRFGFFLSRPLSGRAIWAGKLVGGALVVLGCEAIICAPAWVPVLGDAFDGTVRSMLPYAVEDMVDVVGLLGVFLAPVVLFLLAHAFATMWRGRGAWLVLDIVTVSAAAAGTWLVVRSLLRDGAESAATWVGVALGLSLIATLAGAPVYQVSRGGVHLRRQHRLLSMTLAAAVAVSLAVAAGYVRWLKTPSVVDLLRGRNLAVNASPNGRWIAVHGYPKGRMDYPAKYLFDLGSSATLRVDPLDSRVHFSGDGRRAAWLAGEGDVCQVRYCDLAAVPLRTRGTILFVGDDSWFRLSPNGERIAIVEDGVLSVSTFPAGELVGSMVAGPLSRLRLVVGDDGVVHFDQYSRSPESSEWIRTEVEFDPSTGSHRRTQSTESKWFERKGYDPARDRALIRQSSDEGAVWRYVEASTLEDVDWTLRRPLQGDVMLLEDGRILEVLSSAASPRIRVLAPDGTLEGDLSPPPELQRVLARPEPLGGHRWERPRLEVGPQVGPDQVAIGISSLSEASTLWYEVREHHGAILDVRNGDSQVIERGLKPLTSSRWWEGWLGDADVVAGGLVKRLFRRQDGSLVLWNPETGELEDLAVRYE